MEPGSDGKLPAVDEYSDIAGGHETCLYGYDQAKSLFYGINSWGTSWGNNGLYLMPSSGFPIFKKLGGYDAHYIDVQWGAAPFRRPTVPTRKIRLSESADNGATWKTLFEGVRK